MSVAMYPGLTVLHRIPCRASSTAIARVSPLSPAVLAMYAAARVAGDDPGACAAFRGARDALLGLHPQSPLLPEARATFEGVPYFPHDPALLHEWRDGNRQPRNGLSVEMYERHTNLTCFHSALCQ